MFKKSPIVIVDDDPDDQQLIQEALESLHVPNPLLIFSQGSEAFQYIKNTSEQPFIIICDINMPGMNGLELLTKIHTELPLQKRSVPFIIFSTSAMPDAIQKAYSLYAQGFFVKPYAMSETRRVLQLIINYWQSCRYPSNKEQLLANQF